MGVKCAWVAARPPPASAFDLAAPKNTTNLTTNHPPCETPTSRFFLWGKRGGRKCPLCSTQWPQTCCLLSRKEKKKQYFLFNVCLNNAKRDYGGVKHTKNSTSFSLFFFLFVVLFFFSFKTKFLHRKFESHLNPST